MSVRGILPLILLLPVVALSGCTVEVPADAVVVTNGSVEGAAMHAWIEQAPGVVQFHGVFENDSGRALTVYRGYHGGGWNLTILDANGTAVIYEPRLTCTDYWHQFLADKDHEAFTFTWDTRVYEDVAHCKSGDRPAHMAASAGDYTAVVQYLLADMRDDAFEVRLPFALPAMDADA